MACTINLRTALLQDAQPGGVWTYNGAILIEGSSNPFDGNPDNITQFTTSVDPVSAPEEFATINTAGDNPSIDPEGHSIAYYSLTYTVTDGTCTTTNNVVLPIIEGVCFHEEYQFKKTYLLCDNPRAIFDLYEVVNQPIGTWPAGAYSPTCNRYEEKGTWQQISGSPNPHPGFTIDPNDPKRATFDTSTINYPNDNFPIVFRYTAKVNPLPGYSVTNCDNCDEKHYDVEFKLSNTYDCCPNLTQSYTVDIPNDGTVTIYDVRFSDGTLLSSDPIATPPYTAPLLPLLFTHIFLFMVNNQSVDLSTLSRYSSYQNIYPTLRMWFYSPCYGPRYFYTDPGLTTFILPTISNIF